MIDLISRAEWKARSPKGSYNLMPTTARGCKVHYTGGKVDPAILTDHQLCYKSVKGIQNGHMDGNGWTDIGYSFVVCPHRKVFVGRGLRHVPAANGAGLNSGHYAILGLVGNAGLVVPNDDMLLGILDCIDYVRKNGPAGKEIKGHRDGYPTDCPGEHLYAWVKKGAPSPVGGGQSVPEDTDIVSDLITLSASDKDGSFDVKTVRALLFSRGYVPAVPDTELGHWLENIAFDKDLENLVKQFQSAMKLTADGIVGPKTWRKLLRL